MCSSLKRQLDSKWRALDNFEASVKKLEATKMQWKVKYATKEGELDAVKVRHHRMSCKMALTAVTQCRAIPASRLAQGGLVIVRLDTAALTH